VTRTALPIIAILTLRATPSEVAVLAALSVAPGVLVALFVGGRVDRTAKRPMLIGADLVRASCIASVPISAWLGLLAMPQLYAVAAVVGAATTLFEIVDVSWLPSLVGRDRLIDGNAKLQATDSIAEGAGPALAGVLVQLLTAPIAVALDALSHLWSALLLGRIRAGGEPVVVSNARGTVLDDVRTGIRVVIAHPVIVAMLLADAITYLFGGFFLALYMLFALGTLRLSPTTVGVIIGMGGVGAFAGAVIAEPLARRFGMGPALVLALVVGQAAKLLIPLAADAGTVAIPLLVAQQLIGDALLGAYLIHSISLRQRVLPDAVLGRVTSVFHVVTGTVLPAGALLAGPVAAAFGIPAALWVGALGGLLAVAALLRTPVLRMR
jgi:predicted MFS family arabinose efflux permease